MFAAAPPLVNVLIRYWLASEAVKLATGTTKRDLAKAALDASEQIGNAYQAQFTTGERPGRLPAVFEDPITVAQGVLGFPGTAAEAAGYTFPGEFERQRQRLAGEVRGGFPSTRERIRGAPKFAKRKASKWNREIKKAYATAKKQKNQFGGIGKVTVPKKAFPKIVKMVSDMRKGKKPQKNKAYRQIRKALGNIKVKK